LENNRAAKKTTLATLKNEEVHKPKLFHHLRFAPSEVGGQRSENSSQPLDIRNLQRNRLSPFGFALRLIVAALGRRSEMFHNSLLFKSDLYYALGCCLLDSDYSFLDNVLPHGWGGNETGFITQYALEQNVDAIFFITGYHRGFETLRRPLNEREEAEWQRKIAKQDYVEQFAEDEVFLSG
jgi:hypothetical protein